MRIFTRKTWVAFLLPLIWACGEMEEPRIIPQTASNLVTSANSIVLTLEDEEEKIIFNVSEADFGIPTEVTYTLQVDRPGNNFANPVDLGSSTTTAIEVVVGELNSKAVSKGITAGEKGNMEFRVKATVQRSLSPLVGQVKVLEVTTYRSASAIRNLFLVGDATAAGWNNNNNNTPLFRDGANADIYHYTGFFAQGAFKVLEKLGAWQPQYGSNDGSTIAVNPGGGSDPDVISVPAAGYYTLTFNLSNNTFTFVPFTGSTTTTFATVGIIGSATSRGWDESTAMTKSTFDEHIWRVTAPLTNGEMKFRANNAWDVNWGANTKLSGLGTQGGPNIPVDAGSYAIWFNSLDGRYLLIEQ